MCPPSDDAPADAPSDASPGRPLDGLVSDVVGLSFNRLSEDVVWTVERAFLDTIGVALAGATQSAGRIAGQFVAGGSDGGPSTIVGRDATASPAAAAFANGTAAHCLDYDDVSDATSGHPSACLVPAILAAGEASGASGRDAVTAYVAGFETEAALAERLLPDHYRRGWHATATLGTFGTTAAVAHLLGADADEFHTALNVAASMPAGTKRNFGTMVKPMHVGQAARSGVTAAWLAHDGFDAAEDAITGNGGFFDLYGETSDRAIDDLGFGPELAIRAVGVDRKWYPCCYFTQAPIAAAASLVDAHDVVADDVESVRVTASSGADDALAYDRPTSVAEARFSVEYTVAYAIVHRSMGLEAFHEEALDDPAVEAVRREVDFEIDPDIRYGSYCSLVEIETVDGAIVDACRSVPPGYHTDPLSETDLYEKFVGCIRVAGNGYDASSLYNHLRPLSDRTDLSDLGFALQQ